MANDDYEGIMCSVCNRALYKKDGPTCDECLTKAGLAPEPAPLIFLPVNVLEPEPELEFKPTKD